MWFVTKLAKYCYTLYNNEKRKCTLFRQRTNIRMNICKDFFFLTCSFMHASLCANWQLMYEYAQMHASMHAHAHKHTHTHKQTHMHTHTHTQTHIYRKKTRREMCTPHPQLTEVNVSCVSCMVAILFQWKRWKILMRVGLCRVPDGWVRKNMGNRSRFDKAGELAP